MKKIVKQALSLALVMCMCMALIPMSIAAAPEFAAAGSAGLTSANGPVGAMSIVSAEGKPGELVKVAIRVDDNPGVIAGRVGITYDRSVMEMVKAEDCGLWGKYTFGGDIKSVPYYFVWENGTAPANFTGTGNLVMVTFKILEDAKEGSYPVKIYLIPDDIFNIDLQVVTFVPTHGVVKVVKEGKPVIDKQPTDQTALDGDTVQFNVAATGNSLNYQWQLCYVGGKTWQNVPASFAGGNSSTLSFRASMARSGYSFRCVITDAAGNKVISNPATLKVKNASGPLAVKSLTASKTTVNSGETITVTAQGTGGSGDYTYKFIINDTSNDSWYRLQNFSKNNTITWKATTAGTKRIMVDIKDSEGHTVGKNIPIKVNGSVQKPLSVELKASKTTAESGETVTFTAVAKGGSGKYSYKFIINDTTDNKWYRLQDYGRNNVITWKATTPGKKRVMVDVMDSTGKRVGHNVAVIVG